MGKPVKLIPTIQALLDDVAGSSTLGTRKETLEKFRRYFLHAPADHIEKIDAKAWNAIFDHLFQLIAVDETSYAKAKESTKSTLETKLGHDAKAIRNLVEFVVSRIETRTIKHILDHILQCLPTGSGLFSPISNEYLKALKCILESQTHVEHLRGSLWQGVLGFCIENLGRFLEPLLGSVGSTLRSSNASFLHGSVTRSVKSQTATHQTDDLVACIKFLHTASNGDFQTLAHRSIDALASYLEVITSYGRAHLDALTSINLILERVASCNTALTIDSIKRLMPLLSTLWAYKSSQLRDEILRLLIITRLHVAKMFKGKVDESFSSGVTSLISTLQDDFSQRASRDQLHMDDLDLKFICSGSVLRLPAAHGLTLKAHNAKAESNWTGIYFLASYSMLLDDLQIKTQHNDRSQDGRGAKRARLSSYAEDFMRSCYTASPRVQSCVLQVMIFRVTMQPLSADQLEKIINFAIDYSSGSNPSIASWAYLLLVHCTLQLTAKSQQLSGMWHQVWQLASGAVSSLHTSRACCFLLHQLLDLELVKFSVVSQSLDAMLQLAEIAGPAVLADTSIRFWQTVVKNKLTENPSASNGLSETLLQWLFAKWTPSNFDDRLHVSGEASNTTPFDILQFIRFCAHHEFLQIDYDEVKSSRGPVMQSWIRHNLDSELLQYLLLLQEPEFLHGIIASPSTNVTTLHSRTDRKIDGIILDYCTSEASRSFQKLKDLTKERVQAVSGPVIRLLTSQCLVNDHIRAFCFDSVGTKKTEFEIQAESLLAELALYLGRPDVEIAKIDLCMMTIASILPSPTKIVDKIALNPVARVLFSTAIKISKVLEQNRDVQMTVLVGDTPMEMNFDDGFETQTSQGKHQKLLATIPRDAIAAAYDETAFRRILRCHLVFLACVIDQAEAQAQPLISPSFMSYFLDLTPEDLCLSWSVLSDIFASPLELKSHDLNSIFDRVGETCLADYRFGHHDAALSVCVDVLAIFAHRWTSQEDSQVHLFAQEMYQWFVKKGIPNDFVSNHVEILITRLCFTILGLRGPEFRSDDSPDVRDCLIYFLDRDLPVMFEISHNISDIFYHFTLGEHEGAFDLIFNKLLLDLEQPERMGIRLRVLSTLAAKWHTLLRRCVYHIFETAGDYPATTTFASIGIKAISTALSIKHERELFVLFASQLLFSWLREHTIASIPYPVFGYESLVQLLKDVEGEVTAQVFLKANESAREELCENLALGSAILLTENFGKAAAYCFAEDSGSKKAKANAKPNNLVEQNLHTALGEKMYLHLFQSQYPEVLANLLSILESSTEDKLLKHFHDATSMDLKYAQNALFRMRSYSESAVTLTPDQQPCCSSRLLVDCLRKLSKRSGKDLKHLFSPPVYVYVLRSLLQKIHPSLGSLHACSMLRKVRVLISLSGDTALDGYSLEMTLHALRPFLTDPHCSNDASGIVQYLLDLSIPALVRAVPFVTGFLVAVLISLVKFSASTQDSTTQERDHQATIKRAGAFYDWLVNTWVVKFDSRIHESTEAKSHATAFKTLVNAALGAQSDANAGRATAESDLLRALLGQGKLTKRLLKAPSQYLTLNILCDTFKAPSDYKDDVFGDDSESCAYASEVWESCLNLNKVNDEYLLWAGRVVGRARIATNWTFSPRPHDDDIRSLEAKLDGDVDAYEFEQASKTVIFRALLHLLTSGDRNDVGLAEDTLRDIMGQAEATGALQGLEAEIAPQIAIALQFNSPTSVVPQIADLIKPVKEALHAVDVAASEWARDLAVALVSESDDAFLKPLVGVLQGVHGLPEKLLAPIVHLFLIGDLDIGEEYKQLVSAEFAKIFNGLTTASISHMKALLDVVLYLRQRPHPESAAIDAWGAWLTLDPVAIAAAADKCGMHTAALMFAEMISPGTTGRNNSQRRSTSQRTTTDAPNRAPTDLLLSIYRSIDEPDSFYGVHQSNSLASVVQRLDYENDGFKALMFHSARLDSDMRQHRDLHTLDTSGVVHALSRLNLSSVSHAVLRGYRSYGGTGNVLDGAFQAARKLQQWDLGAPEASKSGSAILYRVFQGISNANDLASLREIVNVTTIDVLKTALKPDHGFKPMQESLRILGVLAEIDEVMSSKSVKDVNDLISSRMRSRDNNLANAGYDDYSLLHSSRETIFSMIGKTKTLQNFMGLKEREAREVQVRSLLDCCSFAQKQNGVNETLSTATYLNDLIPICKSVGLKIEPQATELIADILWAQGEHTTSIHMLEALTHHEALNGPNGDLLKATILAKLGHHVGEARLETSQQITQRYLTPALLGLKGVYKGSKAGRVLHEFAAFCDRELHNPDLIEEYERVAEAKEKRRKEVDAYAAIVHSTKNKAEKDRLTKDSKIAQRWYKLDTEEHTRVIKARETLIQQCIQNYVSSLAAWDHHDTDVLRLFSIWLEFSNYESTNLIMQQHGSSIPSAKFAVLMSQLTSLLQEDQSSFSANLKNLIQRICLEHPYHSLHHIFATLNNDLALNNEVARDGPASSRKRAAERIVASLKAHPKARDLWNRIHSAGVMYHNLAIYTDRGKLSTGKDFALDKIPPSVTLVDKIKDLRVPPATMEVALRADCDYSSVPHTIGFKPRMTIASGISAPKILTAFASNGRQFKQLYKAGNDDLRQDAIMEQVFGQVSQLLKKHANTRQRRLQIRTYKVLPLSGNSGIIEFVPNTMPLSDFLQPAHDKYYPGDMRWNKCREKLHSIATQTTDVKSKVRVFQDITAHFNPVLRFFFLERFVDPDEWFQRRLAYTRATAAISMLGHVLGLGDRHCHNILLDQKTGEAVHIDLGIAFEAGRILPVPEVVPFRLSRDIVDGFGITKTEGVFRRCCEFTLDALREERESIMTLLNVLRYDPLVNWTVSPLRAARIQSADSEVGNNLVGSGPGARNKDDGGPASRALNVVEKKLTQVMSTAATVSELIQQASDEKNLAVLYPGWAPWA